MTEKRFYLDENGINDREYEFSILGEDELVDIINELNDENERLKQRVDVLDDQITAQGIVIEGYQNRNQNLSDENEQLKQEKENWKSSACNNANFNSILLNELDIAQEQGYKVSDPFKKLMEEKGDVE